MTDEAKTTSREPHAAHLASSPIRPRSRSAVHEHHPSIMAVGNSKLVSLNLLKNGKRRSSAAHHKNLESIHVLQDAGIAHTQREYWESRLKKKEKEEPHHANPTDSWWLNQRRIQRALSAIDTHDSIKIKDSLTDADFQNLRLDLVANSPRVEGSFGKINFNDRSINPTTTGVVVDLDDLKNTDVGINSGLTGGFVDPTAGNILVTPSIENAKSQSEPPPSSDPVALDSQATMRLVGVDSVEIYQLQQQLEDSYDDLEKTRRELIETKDKLDDVTQELQQLRDDTDARIRTEVAKQSAVWQEEKQKMQVEEAKRKARKLRMRDKEVQTAETTFDGALGFASVSYIGDVVPEQAPVLSAYSSHEYLEDDPTAPTTPNRRRSSSGMEIVREDKFADLMRLSDKRSQSSTASESDDFARKPKDMQKFAPIMEDDEFDAMEKFPDSSQINPAVTVGGSLNEEFEKKSIGASLENAYVDGDDFMSVGSRTMDNAADGLDDVDETTALIPKNDEKSPKEKQKIEKKVEKVVEDFGTAKKLGIEDDTEDFSTQKGGENLRTGRNQAMFQDLDDKCCGCICCHQSFGW